MDEEERLSILAEASLALLPRVPTPMLPDENVLALYEIDPMKEAAAAPYRIAILLLGGPVMLDVQAAGLQVLFRIRRRVRIEQALEVELWSVDGDDPISHAVVTTTELGSGRGRTVPVEFDTTMGRWRFRIRGLCHGARLVALTFQSSAPAALERARSWLKNPKRVGVRDLSS
jgi:hypothetical protein